MGWKRSYGAHRSSSARDGTHLSEDWQKLVAHPAIDIVIEATGNPPAAVEHALAAFRNRKHVVMVTVEADAFCGPLLARKAAEAGVVYSLAYGDQPALICDLVDWARAAGFPVVAAGRGHKWLPHFAQSTPETVWGHYGLTPEQAKVGGLNPKMFNSFLDGSKPAIEPRVCNATGDDPRARRPPLPAAVGGRDTRADAAEERRRAPRLRRPAGVDLRPRRLGARRGSRWWPRDAATSGCRTSRNRRPRRCGATTA